MPRALHMRLADLQGLSRLGVEAVAGTTQLVESLHQAIAARVLGPLGPLATPITGITRLVYGSIHGVNALVGTALDTALGAAQNSRQSAAWDMTRARSWDSILAVLNGVLGDHLAHSGNALAIPLRLRHDGRPLELESATLRARFPASNGRLAIFVHGLCMHDRHWTSPASKSGLEGRLQAQGWSTLHLHYNSGLHISTNGRAFAAVIEDLLAVWPGRVRSLAIIAHSMGGLVTRSACDVAHREGQAWLTRLGSVVFLGTPHHGAPLERIGNHVTQLLATTPYSAPFARLSRLRSAGITDLRHACLRDEDWQTQDRFSPAADLPTVLPLPEGPRYFAVAGGGADLTRRMLGDGLVPVASALGQHPDPSRDLGLPAKRTWTAPGVGHLELLHHPDVQARVLRWLHLRRTQTENPLPKRVQRSTDVAT